MSRVDFYILKDAGENARQLFACRLAEKAYRLKHSVHIHADSREIAARIDDLLWTFRDGSFVPHEVLPRADTTQAPVTIGFGENAAMECDLLINLGSDLPGCGSAFPRIAEIVSSNEENRQQSRRRFIQYREQGYTLESHNIE